MIPIAEGQLGRAERMLVALCRRDLDGALDLACLEPPALRRELRDLAADHRVLGLVLLALTRQPGWGQLSAGARADLLEAPPPERARIRRGARDRRRSLDDLRERARAQDRELEDLLLALHADRLDPLVLKGPALRRVAYADPVERRYSDFDLLFPPEEVERALRVVRAAGYEFPFSLEKLRGYRELHFHVLLRKSRRFRAEIHWALSRPTECFRLDANAFLRDSVRVSGSGACTLRVPRAEHLLLHLSHDNLRDSFSRLGRIVDLDRIVASAPDLDWDIVLAQARAGGLGPLLGLSLELSRALFGSEIPAEVRRRLQPGRATRAHLGWMAPAPSLLGERFRGIGPSLALLLWLSAGARNRWRQLASILSGRRFSEQWIYRGSGERPPTSREALAAGLKQGLQVALYHVGLYGRRLALRTRPAPRLTT